MFKINEVSYDQYVEGMGLIRIPREIIRRFFQAEARVLRENFLALFSQSSKGTNYLRRLSYTSTS